MNCTCKSVGRVYPNRNYNKVDNYFDLISCISELVKMLAAHSQSSSKL